MAFFVDDSNYVTIQGFTIRDFQGITGTNTNTRPSHLLVWRSAGVEILDNIITADQGNSGAFAIGATAREIHVRVKPRVASRSKETTTLDVDVSIDPAGVTFEEKDGQWLASLELAVVAADNSETIVGEVWEPVDLQLDAEGYTLLKKQNIVCTVRVEATAPPRLVKAIVYDVGTDKVGSAEARIR